MNFTASNFVKPVSFSFGPYISISKFVEFCNKAPQIAKENFNMKHATMLNKAIQEAMKNPDNILTLIFFERASMHFRVFTDASFTLK